MARTYIRFPEGKKKVLTLSYDDGVVQDIRLINILNKHGIKATFNLNSACWLSEEAERERYYGRMKISEAKELYINSGHEIAVHALTHPHLDKLSDTEVVYEIMEDRKNLERDFGGIVKGMAYPFGTFNDKVVDILEKCGICYSRTTVSTENFAFPPKKWLELPATCHHNNPRLMELAENFVNEEPRWGQVWMFYLWGHSYEFDNNNNWEVIEKFAEFIGGREDIWYATNMEVYEYNKAYESLVKSADGNVVYNPTNTTVWFWANEEIELKPGETVAL